MVRRLKRTLPPRWDGTPRFPRRNLDYLEVSYSEPERRAHGLLNRHAASLRSCAADKAAKAAADLVTSPDGLDAPVFRLPELPGAWATARNAGLHHPVTGAER